MLSGIYIITNILRNKVYIGRSKNWKKRLNQHKLDLIKQRHPNDHLQNSFNVDALENFTFELLEEYPVEFLPSMENWWCNMLNAHNREYGYNIEPTSPYGMIRLSQETKNKLSAKLKGRTGTWIGRTHSEETKAKISKAKTGKKVSEEVKEKQRIVKLGKKYTEEARKNMSKAQKGRKFSPETIEKMRIAKKGKPSNRKGIKHTEETKIKLRKPKKKTKKKQL